MIPSRRSYDVIIVGAGPGGSVAAVAHARQGASVLLLEADPRAAKRFAGEWLHPTGVSVLDELRIGRLEPARARSGYGFVIFPDDGSEPIEMPYSEGVALSGEHGELVLAMREAAQGYERVELCTDARAVRVAPGVVRVEDRESGTTIDVRAGRVVGAEGKKSLTRRSLGLEENSAPLSYMAAVELRDAELPFEGFGHVVLGGPGPALFYRIGDGVIRGCLDVPVALGPSARAPQMLWDGFAPVVPASLKTALRAALERGPSGWAINRFRPRTSFGRDSAGEGEVALIGDAVGHVHPMTAIGMTMALSDARTLAESKSVRAYGKARRGYIPELLSNALYHCFRRDDPSATAVRRAMFDTLRADPRERRRTMDILAGANPRRRSFGSAFLRIAAQAVGRTVSESRDLSSLPRTLAGFGEWMQWPAAIVFPPGFDAAVREHSSSTHPIPQLERIVPTAAPLTPPAEPERRPEEVPLSEAIDRGADRLLVELERIATQVGSVPDAILAGPALSSMRAVLATEMRPGLAARMTLGRRRLAVDGFTRLLASDALPSPRHLAELALVLFGGASWDALPVASLAEGVRALLDAQRADGAFAERNADDADLELTALACRALSLLAARYPEASDADLDAALGHAASFWRSRQGEDGSCGGDVSSTAWMIDGLWAAGTHAGDPALRRAQKWLAGALHEGCDEAAAARALFALTRSGAPGRESFVKTARRLAERVDAPELEWDLVREIVEALAACESRRLERPRKARRSKPKANGAATFEMAGTLADDWAYCKKSLGEVSRTFARPIALLPGQLEVAVSLGYLLCRIADTVEDHVAVDAEDRDELFRQFLAVLEGGDASTFVARFGEITEAFGKDDAELELSRNTPRVMRVFASLSDNTQAACIRWVSEMARGMNLYTARRPGDDGIYALHTVPDLERYCYYVAGTVGHLLTDLFLEAIEAPADGELALELRDHAEGFAMGLQLTNILKDVTDDLERSVTFVPRSECIRQGFAPGDLADPELRAAGHRAVAPLFDVARKNLDEALLYSLAIPKEHVQIRLFCLLPLWMAARTLVLARGNDAMFVTGAPVKISRPEVEALIAECVRLAADDDALRARYARLFEPGAASAAG